MRLCAIDAFHWGTVAPQDTFANVWRHFRCHSWEGMGSGWRPGILVNILQSTGQTPTPKNDWAPTVKDTKVEKLSAIDKALKYFLYSPTIS